jgi:hypothetical protein
MRRRSHRECLIRAGVQDFGWDSEQVERRLGGEFAWEHFRIAFTERRQDREGHETDACKQVRGGVSEEYADG